MNLTLFKNDVIPVYTTDLGNKVVDARELHKSLGLKKQFTTWFKGKAKEHNLVENEDYCSLSLKVKREIGGSIRTNYVIRLHSAKKIALGTNNEAGDRIKDYFIECESIIKQSLKTFDPTNYIGTPNQKIHVKTVGGVLYSQNKECTDIIKHHQDNCILHFGKKPNELRKELVSQGMRVKSKSGRDIARIIKPEAAASMAVHDDYVANGHTMQKLMEVKLKEKLEATFKVVMELGFTPKQLLT